MKTKLYIDFDKMNQEMLFITYKQHLLHLVGISPSKELEEAANKYLHKKYKEYRQFITL